jgi:hypothetical protein
VQACVVERLLAALCDISTSKRMNPERDCYVLPRCTVGGSGEMGCEGLVMEQVEPDGSQQNFCSWR